MPSLVPTTRARVGWWLLIVVLAGAAAFIAHSFIGILVLGVFGYYATRPICNYIQKVVDSDSLAAGLTVSVVLVPILLVLLYTGVQIFQQVQQLSNGATASPLVAQVLGIDALPMAQRRSIVSLLQNPRAFFDGQGRSLWSIAQSGLQVAQALFGAILLIALSVTLSYFLLENDETLSDDLAELFGGRDTTAYAYAVAVDADLRSVFFGNLLFVIVMSVIAFVTYAATNYFAPEGLHIPILVAVAFLTGVTSVIPIVVSKVVYLPVVGYLAFQAQRAGGNQMAFVGGALVVYFLVLDILPQTFIQPYITGRDIDMVLMLFAYILGPMLFGWYGFFLLPIVFVLMLEAIRIVLPELLHGDPVLPDVVMGENVGHDPSEESDAVADAEGSADADPADSGGAEPGSG